VYIAQIICEDNVDELRDTIISLLTAVAAEGLTNVGTVQILKDLRRSGYTINRAQLQQLLQNIPIVKSADRDTISVVTNRSAAEPGDDLEKSKDRVNKMATKQAKDELA